MTWKGICIRKLHIRLGFGMPFGKGYSIFNKYDDTCNEHRNKKMENGKKITKNINKRK